jgi:hypothetical protein
LSLLIGDEFNQLFKSFEHTAFRLEVRYRYNAPSEAESLRKFLAGEPDERRWKAPWLDMIREITAEGKRFERVRVVGSPLLGSANGREDLDHWALPPTRFRDRVLELAGPVVLDNSRATPATGPAGHSTLPAELDA